MTDDQPLVEAARFGRDRTEGIQIWRVYAAGRQHVNFRGSQEVARLARSGHVGEAAWALSGRGFPFLDHDKGIRAVF